MIALVVGERPKCRAELEARVKTAGFETRVDDYSGAAATVDRIEWPALVILDFFGGDPWGLCRRIRAQARGERALIWVVVETSDPKLQQAALEAGADDCIVWPQESQRFELQVAAAVRRVTAMEEIPRAEAALRESLERWSLVERGARGGVWDARPNGRHLDAPDNPVWYSPGMKELFGFSEAEFPNVLSSWLSRVHPDEVQQVIQAIKQCLAERSQFEIEYRLLTKAAGYRWFSSRGQGVFDREDRLVRIAGSIRDITEKKWHEVALRQEQELLRRLLDLHERDRQLVAYEIHDGLAQEMTAALMHLQAFQHVAAEHLENSDFERGLNLLREAVQEARRLISGLRPPVLDELGIVAAIEYLIHENRPDVPDIKFVHHTRFVRLAPPLESAIFRIVQETLSNIRAHSGSRRAKIELLEHGQQLRLVVRDWGKGFDPAQINEGRFGLQGIRERGRLMGAKVVIESHPGKGTTVVVDFPLILDRNENGPEQTATEE